MYENISYNDRKRYKDYIVLNRLRERNVDFDQVNVCWQLNDRQSDVLKVIVMKSWHVIIKLHANVRKKIKRAFHAAVKFVFEKSKRNVNDCDCKKMNIMIL